jgi:hypothetical protein
MAFAPLVIRWGADTSSDMLRRCARCTKCGTKGATLQQPGWMGEQIGFAPFPVPKVDNVSAPNPTPPSQATDFRALASEQQF